MTTWNSADKSNITLSNSDLDAANTTSANAFVRSTTSKSADLYYWEQTLDVITGGFFTVGLANASYTIAGQNIPGFDSNANALGVNFGAGSFYGIEVGGVALGLLTSGAVSGVVGDIMANCYKFSTNQYWGRVRRAAAWLDDWNATVGADPAAGTGGITLTGLNAGPYFIVAGGQTAADRVTLNPGPTGLITAMPPSTFSAWDSGAATTQTRDHCGALAISRSVVRGDITRVTRWVRNASKIFVPAKDKLWLPQPLTGVPA